MSLVLTKIPHLAGHSKWRVPSNDPSHVPFPTDLPVKRTPAFLPSIHATNPSSSPFTLTGSFREYSLLIVKAQ